MFFWSKLSKLHQKKKQTNKTKQKQKQNKTKQQQKKKNNFACGNYILPKTSGNKNKPWTHSTLLKACYHIDTPG